MNKKRLESMAGRKAFLELIHDEKMMRFPSLENRIKRDKCKATKRRNLSILREQRRLSATGSVYSEQ